MANIKYRLALDVGASSLGWCVYHLDQDDEPDKIVRLGSRIFSDGRTSSKGGYATLAAGRRAARQARRRRDRVLKRRQRFMRALIQHGLMPADEMQRKQLQTLDPYELRGRGLHGPLTLYEFGRALYHLARKRGFRSSRKERRSGDAAKEGGKFNTAIDGLKRRMVDADCETVGEYLAKQHAVRAPVRARRSSDGTYVLYLQRAMVEGEFDTLWERQQEHHPQALSALAREELREIMLFQRRLKAVEPGRCLFNPSEYRARLCAPLQQRFRMLQDLNHLRVRDGLGDRSLTLDERNRMLAVLEHDAGPRPVSFARLADAAGLHGAGVFNYGRDAKRTGLKGDAVGARFSAPDAIGAVWYALDSRQQYALAVLVALADQSEPLVAALVALPDVIDAAGRILDGVFDPAERTAIEDALRSLPIRLDPAVACKLASFDLPDGHGSLGLEAMHRIVLELERDVVTYNEAVQRAGFGSHSQRHTGEIFPRHLPYYGEVLRGHTMPAPASTRNDEEREYGRIPNPTVHIGLNQVRQLVNAVMRRYGSPHQVVIELAREFGASGDRRREIIRQQKAAQDRNERYDAFLTEHGVRVNRENRQRLQLWDELGNDAAADRYCVYSGQRIDPGMLFSDEVEIDHILPRSRSLHDGIGNKILCMRQSNREKGERTPFEAWGHTDRWRGIEARVKCLPAHKGNLFKERALETYLGEGGFLARYLSQTAHLGRAVREYMTYVCPENQVWVSNGRLTSLLRNALGMPKLLWSDGAKNRSDHRHHALDAAAIGLCSRSMVQRVAAAAKRSVDRGMGRFLESLELPWPEFREDLKASLDAVVVSHKPDHGKQAALHNETNYGWRGAPDKRGNPVVGRRRPLDSIKGVEDAASIADARLRGDITLLLAAVGSPKEVKAALLAYSERTGVRRVICEERLAVLPIRDRRSGEPYRYVKGDGNFCYEIFRKPDGSWDGEVISTFKANKRGFSESKTSAQSGAPLVMRIHKGDMVAIDENGAPRYVRVVSFSDGKIMLAGHTEADAAARSRSHDDDFKLMYVSVRRLRELCGRLVGVNVLGYVNDPGFHERGD